ncbi:MAG TPA: tripartite tricarboxylate transporter substrate binding protein [Roseateles sp.]|nr:tripartite tricarboxylate transporter substrate binding protein [Roseateles sp.]
MQRRSMLAAALALWLPQLAPAQELPKKPLTLVVGFAAGGATDAAARIIAKKLQENLGQSVVVENRAGAGGNIAHQAVAAATPDGSTILLGSIGPLTIAPHMMKVGYEPFKDLAPLTMGVMFPNVLVVHPGTGIKSFADFIARARARPGALDFASTGAGSASHLAGELLNQRAGIETIHIPYKGGAPALQDLLGARVAAYYAAPPTALPHIEAGKLIAIATTGLSRPAFMPNVPTIAESGYPGFNASNWYAFVAPGKTAEPVLERWNKELVKVLNAPEVQEDLRKHGLTPAPNSRKELAAFIASESRTWGQLVRDRRITAD